MSDSIVSILNELVETSKDGEKGFNTAAEETKTAELQTTFRRRAQDCATGAKDLQQLVTGLGGRPEDGGSVSGAVHRGWVTLKSAVAARSDLAILEECERGEDVAKARYGKALETTLPEDIRMVVKRQYDGVIHNHDQIRDLRDRYQVNKSSWRLAGYRAPILTQPIKDWAVLGHGKLPQIHDGILPVGGEIHIPVRDLLCRMTVARLTDSRLVVFSGLR